MFNPNYLLAAALCVSAAHATPSSQLTAVGAELLTAGGSLADAVDAAYAAGDTSDPAEQSEAAYDEVAAIIDGHLATHDWSDAQERVEGAIGLAEIYAYNDESEDDIRMSRLAANWTALTVELALEDTAEAGLQGVSTYAMLAAMDVVFWQEVVDITVGLGESTAYYESQLEGALEDHLNHLASMETEWAALTDDLYPISRERVAKWKSGGVTYKQFRKCFDGPDGTECSGSSYLCATVFFTTSCQSASTVNNQINALRDAQLAADEDAIFGSEYDALVSALESF